jgi:protein-export membrane protein SecD
VKKRPLVVMLAITLSVVVGAWTGIAFGLRPVLGLDLRGGISAVYTPVLPEGQEVPEDFEAILDETIDVIRARVDSLGVAEPDISRQGTDVLVQLPGVSDADRLRDLIGTTAQLRFRPVIEVIPPGSPAYAEGPDCAAPVDERLPTAEDDIAILCGRSILPAFEGVEGLDLGDFGPPKYRVGPSALTGETIRDALPVVQDSGYAVSVDLDAEGGAAFASVTSDLACERDLGAAGLLAIVLDDIVESAPAMNPDVRCGVGITGGSAVITVGAGTLDVQRQEAEDLALVLRTGALPITLVPSTFETVSPTLGSDSLEAGLLAGAIGLLLVGLLLVAVYRWLGLVALSSLLVFASLVFAVISLLGSLGFALTLAGVAGIIVSIGITADSSILFLERIRDELDLGKSTRSAVTKGFASAFRTNLTGNTVTFAAAVILYALAIGPIRGFALMLGLATILDIIILYCFTRPVVFLLAGTRAVRRRGDVASGRAVAASTAGGTA